MTIKFFLIEFYRIHRIWGFCRMPFSVILKMKISKNSILQIFFYLVCRYVEIIHSLWHRVYFTKKAVYISISVVWIIGFLLVSTYFIPTTKVLTTSYTLTFNIKESNHENYHSSRLRKFKQYF